MAQRPTTRRAMPAGFTRAGHPWYVQPVVRRLPVLQNNDAETEGRPAWHYVPIGAGFTITLWLPLAMLALWAGPRLALVALGARAGDDPSHALSTASEASQRWAGIAQVLPLLLSFFLACFASGILVGRFGGRAGRREAITANLAGSAVVLLLALAAGDVTLAVVAAAAAFLASSSVVGGWGGALLGLRLRPSAKKRP